MMAVSLRWTLVATTVLLACDLDEVEVKNDKGATYKTETESRGTRVLTAPDGGVEGLAPYDIEPHPLV